MRQHAPGEDPRGLEQTGDSGSKPLLNMLAKLKPFIGPAVVTVIVLAIVSRVPALRTIVLGTAS